MTPCRKRIRAELGFREASGRDVDDLVGWLVTTVLPHERTLDRVRAAVGDHCRATSTTDQRS